VAAKLERLAGGRDGTAHAAGSRHRDRHRHTGPQLQIIREGGRGGSWKLEARRRAMRPSIMVAALAAVAELPMLDPLGRAHRRWLPAIGWPRQLSLCPVVQFIHTAARPHALHALHSAANVS
jgi:hypothetical protein